MTFWASRVADERMSVKGRQGCNRGESADDYVPSAVWRYVSTRDVARTGCVACGCVGESSGWLLYERSVPSQQVDRAVVVGLMMCMTRELIEVFRIRGERVVVVQRGLRLQQCSWIDTLAMGHELLQATRCTARMRPWARAMHRLSSYAGDRTRETKAGFPTLHNTQSRCFVGRVVRGRRRRNKKGRFEHRGGAARSERSAEAGGEF